MFLRHADGNCTLQKTVNVKSHDVTSVLRILILHSLSFRPCVARGRGTPHMKGVGMLVGNFELHPLKETDPGVAQAFFNP